MPLVMSIRAQPAARWFFLLACPVLLVIAGSAGRPATALSAEQPRAEKLESMESLKQLIQQLDADQYETRHRAEQQLAAAGSAALEAVSQVAAEGSLESSTRALNILLGWCDATSAELRLAALEKVAALKNRPKEALLAVELLQDARQQTALEAIVELGGQYDRDAQIRGLRNLQIIIGEDWKGGYAGLQHLADIPDASTISLHAVALDERALDYLDDVPRVARIEFYGTLITPAQAEKFQQSLPPQRNITVEHRLSAALLGIRGNVEHVEPNSAAARAGIRRRDVITQIGGEDVADFAALTKRIATYQPGETVTLTVLRGDKTIPIDVTLGQWGKNKSPRLQRHSRNLPPPRRIFIPRR